MVPDRAGSKANGWIDEECKKASENMFKNCIQQLAKK